MRKLRHKLIKAVITISLMLLACTIKVSAAEKLLPEQFTDLPTGWSREAMVSAIDNGFLYGYNNKIYPKDYLTRAQLASVVNRAFGTSLLADLTEYTDVPSNAWFTEDLSYSVYSKRMVGYNNKLFPQRDATREEVYTVLARAINLSSSNDLSSVQQFTDYSDISPWASDELAAMVESGYMRGVSGKLQPKAKMTREEFAYVLQSFSGYYSFAQAIEMLEPEDRYYLEDVEQTTDEYSDALEENAANDTSINAENTLDDVSGNALDNNNAASPENNEATDSASNETDFVTSNEDIVAFILANESIDIRLDFERVSDSSAANETVGLCSALVSPNFGMRARIVGEYESESFVCA